MTNTKLPYLRKVLKNSYYEDLRTIASNLKIKGRSKMNFDELVDSIASILKNEEYVLNLLKSLNENALNILDIVRDFDGFVERKKAIQEFGKSQSTFRKYIQILEKYGLVYYDYDNDAFFVPKEILRFLNDFIMEKEEKMSIDDFLDYYLTTEQLKDICIKFDLSTSGRKQKLISTIISSKISEKDILNTLSVYDLKIIAEDMGLSKSGRKEDLINRILEQIEVSVVKEYTVTNEKVEEPSKKTATKKKKLDALYEGVVETIDKYFKPTKPVSARLKEKQIEDQLLQFLRGRFPQHTVEIEKSKKDSRIDISVDEKIGIELKYNTTDYDRVVGQVERYLSDFPKVILVIVLSGVNDKLIKKANSAKSRIENKGVKVIIKTI